MTLAKKVVLASVVFVVAIGATLTYLAAKPPASSFPFPVPKPNGYEGFIEAANALQGPIRTTNAVEHNAVLAMNTEALALLSQAVTNRAEAPEWIYDVDQMSHQFMPAIAKMKQLGWLLEASAKAASAEGNWSKAADESLKLLRFGQALERGPLICLLVGLSTENLGVRTLSPILPKLSEENRARVKIELQKLNRERIKFSEVRERETYFARKNAGVWLRVMMKVHPRLKVNFGAQEKKYDATVREVESLTKP